MRDWPSLLLTFPSHDASLPDHVAAALDGADVAAIEEQTPTRWLVSFRESRARDAAAETVQAAWAHAGVTAVALDVSDEDWARRSQANLGIIRVGRFIVTPPWCAPEADAAAAAAAGPGSEAPLTLVIEPSMGFGSGHHATTRLCLEALQTLNAAGARVIDLGTGSGILAVAAARLGAFPVIALDHDPDALDAARAAAAANAPLPGLSFVEADFRTWPAGAADIVLANLTGTMLAADAQAVAGHVVPGGHAVLSGITTAEAQAVLGAWRPLMDLRWRGDRDGWVGLLLRKPA